jgi:2-phosphoglycerate kinase
VTERERRRFPVPIALGGEDDLPFSKGMMARALMASGLTATSAYELARRAELDLERRGAVALDLDRLHELAGEVLAAPVVERAMRRLRRWTNLAELDLPLVLLVGGGTGTGKSTLATEAAHRLGITRVTSTDFVRQTMRAFFSKAFMPSIHYSSFEARLALTRAEEEETGDATLLGFLDQTRNVLVGVEAAIDRALAENWSMVLEGIHLVPGMLAVEPERALVVQCVVAIHDEPHHRGHFEIRDASAAARPADKYIEGFPEIRMIQDYIVERARRNDVPVIENTSVDRALEAILDLVLERAAQVTAVAR